MPELPPDTELMVWPPHEAELVLEGQVLGKPATAGSKSSGVVTVKGPDGKRVPKIRDGRVQTYTKDDSGEEGKAWRSAVHDVVAELYREARLIDQPAVLEFRVVRVRNGSDYKADGTLRAAAPLEPAVRPDISKQLRAFEDALARVVIREDSRFVKIFVEKVYGDAPERAEFRLWKLPSRVGDSQSGPGKSVTMPDQGTLLAPA